MNNLATAHLAKEEKGICFRSNISWPAGHPPSMKVSPQSPFAKGEVTPPFREVGRDLELFSKQVRREQTLSETISLTTFSFLLY